MHRGLKPIETFQEFFFICSPCFCIGNPMNKNRKREYNNWLKPKLMGCNLYGIRGVGTDYSNNFDLHWKNPHKRTIASYTCESVFQAEYPFHSCTQCFLNGLNTRDETQMFSIARIINVSTMFIQRQWERIHEQGFFNLYSTILYGILENWWNIWYERHRNRSFEVEAFSIRLYIRKYESNVSVLGRIEMPYLLSYCNLYASNM